MSDEQALKDTFSFMPILNNEFASTAMPFQVLDWTHLFWHVLDVISCWSFRLSTVLCFSLLDDTTHFMVWLFFSSCKINGPLSISFWGSRVTNITVNWVLRAQIMPASEGCVFLTLDFKPPPLTSRFNLWNVLLYEPYCVNLSRSIPDVVQQKVNSKISRFNSSAAMPPQTLTIGSAF